MGIVLKRRDNAPIVKIIYGGIIDRIMKDGDIKLAINWTRRKLREFIQGKYGLHTLILSKTLSSYYKDPDRIAHKVLADRIAERDPGNKPQVNDRIPFIYIDVSKTKFKNSKLQGDRIEHPDYIIEHDLKPDYEHYITNQIMKPVSQIFGLCLEEIDGFNKDIVEFNNIYKKQLSAGKTINESLKKMLEAKNKEAGNIVFRDILRILNNRKQRTKEITDYFR
jgi:DNA polymerase elongation subunit (family B)